MSMSDLMSRLNLDVYPQVALVIFLAVFGLAVWRVVRAAPKHVTQASRLPMDDAPVAGPAPRMTPEQR